jgi:hypothetical protein
MKQVAIAAILGVLVAIGTSCGNSSDNSAAGQVAVVEQTPLCVLEAWLTRSHQMRQAARELTQRGDSTGLGPRAPVT